MGLMNQWDQLVLVHPVDPVILSIPCLLVVQLVHWVLEDQSLLSILVVHLHQLVQVGHFGPEAQTILLVPEGLQVLKVQVIQWGHSDQILLLDQLSQLLLEDHLVQTDQAALLVHSHHVGHWVLLDRSVLLLQCFQDLLFHLAFLWILEVQLLQLHQSVQLFLLDLLDLFLLLIQPDLVNRLLQCHQSSLVLPFDQTDH